MTCRYLQAADEAYAIGEDGREHPTTVLLCTWGLEAPRSADALLDTPRWLQRNAMSGHLWREGDCKGCPGYSAQAQEAR